jgi:hypothetical protein
VHGCTGANYGRDSEEQTGVLPGADHDGTEQRGK